MEHSKLDTSAAVGLLRELSAARSLLDPFTLAERATAILDRSVLAPLDPTGFLVSKGLSGVALARIMPAYSTRLVKLYEAAHGAPPLRRLIMLTGVGLRPVNAYIEQDRPLLERAWADTVLSHSNLGATVDYLSAEATA